MDAKNGLNFGGPSRVFCLPTVRNLIQVYVAASVLHVIPVVTPNLILIPFEVLNPSQILVPGFVPLRPQS